MKLGRKQRVSSQVEWWTAWHAIDEQSPEVARVFDDAVARVASRARRERVAFAWSGGKDSLALELVCRAAGVEQCVLSISRLEYPEFLAWVTEHMPSELTVHQTGIDHDWLRRHPRQLFPRTAADASVWFRVVNHAGQRRYAVEHGIETLCLGRRRADGNYTGPRGVDEYRDRHGFTRWSPIADWSHEQVMAVLKRGNVELPPYVRWPRGFQVGTGSWPARQFAGSREQAWDETWQIDPQVVIEARDERIPGAAEAVERNS